MHLLKGVQCKDKTTTCYVLQNNTKCQCSNHEMINTFCEQCKCNLFIHGNCCPDFPKRKRDNRLPQSLRLHNSLGMFFLSFLLLHPFHLNSGFLDQIIVHTHIVSIVEE